jgi:hypothetical protein
VLGPILFLLYINDMPDVIKCTVLLFADDTKLYNIIDSDGCSEALQKDLDEICKWAQEWQLKFNVEKCVSLNLGFRNKCHTYRMLNYDTNISTEVSHTKSEKDLGVLVDNQLTFTEHVTNQVNKANRLLGLIRRTFSALDKYSFKVLFNSLVLPYFNYCSVLYSPRFQCDKRSVENVLRRASKLVPGLKDLPYANRLRELKLTSMKYRFERSDMVECYKLIHNCYDLHAEEFLSIWVNL